MWKRAALLLAIVALAPGVQAQNASLQGQWEIRAPSIPGYIGVVLIDAEGRATWDAPKDRDKPARFFGYVSRNDGTQVEIPFTNRTHVTRAQCIRQAAPSGLDFDTATARADGVSDTAIADFLAKQMNYDLAGARQAGLTDTQIVDFLAPAQTLNCFNVYHNGTPSAGFALVRVGPGPKSLVMPASR